MKTGNHYEAAFDAFLRRRGVAVIPVVEARRSYLDPGPVKSPDFVVAAPGSAPLIVDVKGRKFPVPSRVGKARPVWRNWCERADVMSLLQWADRLGDGFRGLLAFVYHLELHIQLPAGTPDIFVFRGRRYLLRGVLATDYYTHMRTCSPRWGTVHLRHADFRMLVKPVSHFLGPASAAIEWTTPANATCPEKNRWT